eukprot:10194893-Lingulodinium_polyedra.AAC.1
MVAGHVGASSDITKVAGHWTSPSAKSASLQRASMTSARKPLKNCTASFAMQMPRVSAAKELRHTR